MGQIKGDKDHNKTVYLKENKQNWTYEVTELCYTASIDLRSIMEVVLMM